MLFVAGTVGTSDEKTVMSHRLVTLQIVLAVYEQQLACETAEVSVCAWLQDYTCDGIAG